MHNGNATGEVSHVKWTHTRLFDRLVREIPVQLGEPFGIILGSLKVKVVDYDTLSRLTEARAALVFEV